MSTWLVSLVMGGGIGALGAIVAAYYYGVKSGRAMQQDTNEAKIANVTRKMNDEQLKEVTAKDVEDAAASGQF